MNLLVLTGFWLENSASARIVESLLLIAEQDAISTVSVVFMIAVAVLALIAPAQRAKIRSALMLFATAICLIIASAIAAGAGLPTGSKIIHALALLCGGFAMVKLASIFFFDVLLLVIRL